MRDGRTLTEKAPKPRKLHAMAVGQRLGDVVEHSRNDPLHIPVIEMRIASGQTRNEFGLDHPIAPEEGGLKLTSQLPSRQS